MKREILFRGKRIDNKEWIEGNLAHDAKISFISTSYIDQFEQVFEESVGQFTGLTDKNGTKIFEGDIVDSWSGLENNTETYLREIVFGNNCGLEFKPLTGFTLCDHNTHLFEVVGNIYKNNK